MKRITYIILTFVTLLLGIVIGYSVDYNRHGESCDHTYGSHPLSGITSTISSASQKIIAKYNEHNNNDDCTVAVENYKRNMINEIINLKQDDDIPTGIDFVAFYSKYGSGEILKDIKDVIYNENANSSVRAAAIANIDWDNDVESLTKLLSSQNDSTIITSIIITGSRTQMDEYDRNKFNRAVYDSLIGNPDNRIVSSALNYFQNQDPNWATSVYSHFLSSDSDNDIRDSLLSFKEQFPIIKELFPQFYNSDLHPENQSSN